MEKKRESKRPTSGTSSKAKPLTPSKSLIKPLRPQQAFAACPTNVFTFRTTKEIGASHDFIAQKRAVRAINMGLGIRKPGYNIYIAGYEGTGKTSVIKSFLEKWSAKDETPNDWIYVYDFDKSEQPKAIQLPRGEAKKFKKKMANFIRDLRAEVPKALQSEEYENAINTYLSASNERKSKLYGELEKLAKSLDFTIKSTRIGIETVPVVNGRPITDKEYSKLDDKTREEIEIARNKLEPEVLDFARKVRNIENETRDYIEALRSDFGLSVVGNLINPIIDEYNEQNCSELVAHLETIRDHILENLLDFVEFEEEEQEEQAPVEQPGPDRDPFRKYQINVFIDNAKTKGAPVVIETNPTFYNLFGKIDKNVEHGMYHTDFTMIKCGSIHRANGGYLVLNANDIFRTQGLWETLKRVLRNREAFIEDVVEQFAFLPTSGLRPQPVPLNLKVVLIGNDEIYHTLHEEDEDFHKIFKIKADFDYKMERTQANINSYVSFIATRAKIEELLPFDRSAIASIVEHSSRLVEDQRLLSTLFGTIKDLTIEADFIAREQESTVIKREHVEGALDQKFYRLNMIEESLLQMVENQDILLSVDGHCIGQINGLTVYDMGDYAFGKICRITCTTSISDDGINNIERASRLSGKTHDKGIHIISGFLNAVLAKEHDMGISASICFEQNYGMIDGDSASTAELIAIVSSMAGIPIDQSFAVTGSVNQMGETQAVGGINEKIEGFWKHCQLLGKGRGKQYNVIIPIQNVANLMLHRDVRDAIAEGKLNIYPVKYVWEAFQLVTGKVLGVTSIHASDFVPGSALDIIRQKLEKLHKREEKALKSLTHEMAKHPTPRVAKRR